MSKIATVERSPEKAGVGGSIPSLATMFSSTYIPSKTRFCSILFQNQKSGSPEFASKSEWIMITVGATILALLPLALEGGPLWQPLCYAQMGGLAVATFITLLLVPVLYSVFVLDLKIIRWETRTKES
jgi:hypothetical protein